MTAAETETSSSSGPHLEDENANDDHDDEEEEEQGDADANNLSRLQSRVDIKMLTQSSNVDKEVYENIGKEVNATCKGPAPPK